MSTNKNKRILGYVSYLLASVFLFYVMALQVSPSVMTGELMRDLQIDAASLGILSSAFFYSYTAMQIPAGLIIDRYRLKDILILSIFTCLIGTIVFTVATSLVAAVIGRFLMGAGSTFAFICALTVAARYFPADRYAFFAGVSQFVSGFGAIVGAAPIAVAVNGVGWRHTMWIFVITALLLCVCCGFFVKEQGKANSETEPNTHSSLKDSLKIIFKNKQTWWVGLYAFTSWTPVMVFAGLWGVPYLKALYTINSTFAGMLVALVWFGLMLAGPALGWLSDKMGRRVNLLVYLSALGLLASTLVIYVAPIPFMAMCLLLTALGIATTGQIITFAVVKDINDESVAATAVGVNNMVVVSGAALCQPLVGYLLNQHWDHQLLNGIPSYAIADFRYALAIIPACYLVGLIVSAVFIKETHVGYAARTTNKLQEV